MRLFLTGGTGFLGSNIIRVAREQYNTDILTTVNTWWPESAVDFEYLPVDIADREAIFDAVRSFRPDVIVHSAILNNFPLIYSDRHLAWRLYVEATHHLVDAANEIGCKIILVSTDWVFDGTQVGADETTPPNPVNYYGVLKVACERVVMERANNGAVARVSGVNGVHWLRRDDPQPQSAGYGHFATTVYRGLQQNGYFTVWVDGNVNLRATPSLASDSAEKILRIATGDHQGIFHCTGGESIERLDFARLVAEVFGFDTSLVRSGPVPVEDAIDGIHIPRDTSLNATWTANQLDHPLLDVRSLVMKFKQQVEAR